MNFNFNHTRKHNSIQKLCMEFNVYIYNMESGNESINLWINLFMRIV